MGSAYSPVVLRDGNTITSNDILDNPGTVASNLGVPLVLTNGNLGAENFKARAQIASEHITARTNDVVITSTIPTLTSTDATTTTTLGLHFSAPALHRGTEAEFKVVSISAVIMGKTGYDVDGGDNITIDGRVFSTRNNQWENFSGTASAWTTIFNESTPSLVNDTLYTDTSFLGKIGQKHYSALQLRISLVDGAGGNTYTIEGITFIVRLEAARLH